jgi:hypothetical protein
VAAKANALSDAAYRFLWIGEPEVDKVKPIAALAAELSNP